MEEHRRLDPSVLAGIASSGERRSPRSSMDELQAKLDSLRIRLYGSTAIHQRREVPPTPQALEREPEQPPPEADAAGAQSGPQQALDERLRRARRASAQATAENAKLQRQLRQQQADVARLRGAQRAAAAVLERRVAELEGVAARLTAHNAQLERRAAGATEGWRADLSLLRQRLAAAEHRQRRLHVLCTMPDNEQRDAVLERHRAREAAECGGRAAAPEPAASSFQESLQQLSAELQHIRAMLAGAEHQT